MREWRVRAWRGEGGGGRDSGGERKAATEEEEDWQVRGVLGAAPLSPSESTCPPHIKFASPAGILLTSVK